jgi:hypothetical protein
MNTLMDRANPFVKDSQTIPKVRPTLVESEYILGTARVLEYGANKYGLENWKTCTDIKLYKDALMRHTLAYLSGELVDSDTRELHLYHISCNTMFLSWFENVRITNTD